MSRVYMGDRQVSRAAMGGSAGLFSRAVAVVFKECVGGAGDDDL